MISVMEPSGFEVQAEPRSQLTWLMPVSVALHVALVGVLPNVDRASKPPPPLVIEVAELPPEPRTPDPMPEAEPPKETAASPLRTATTTRAATPAPASAPSEAAPANDAPADFTSTRMSNDGPELGVPGGSGAGHGVPTAPIGSGAPAPAVRAARPRFVAASDLSRSPRAPSLDGALERHYPLAAKRSGVAGRAVLRVKILADGRVGTVERVDESYPGFGEACEKTVRSAAWEPPVDRNGAFVETEITYTCRFEIRS